MANRQVCKLSAHSPLLELPERDRSPVLAAVGRGRGRGRGRGCAQGGHRGRGRGRAKRGRRGPPQPADPPIVWSENYNPPQDRVFTEPSPRPTQRYPNGVNTSEGVFFDAMFTDDMWDLLVTETNRYHDQ